MCMNLLYMRQSRNVRDDLFKLILRTSRYVKEQDSSHRLFLAHCSSFIGGPRVNIESDGVYTYEPTCISYDSPTSRFAFLFRNDSSDTRKRRKIEDIVGFGLVVKIYE